MAHLWCDGAARYALDPAQGERDGLDADEAIVRLCCAKAQQGKLSRFKEVAKNHLSLCRSATADVSFYLAF